jgi:hypothetical protein
MQTNHLWDKAGARITALHAVEHDTDNGIGIWYFVGDLEWSAGKTSGDREIPPHRICVSRDGSEDQGNQELSKALAVMNDHLLTHGKWHDMKFKRDGRGYSWTPKQKKARTPIE